VSAGSSATESTRLTRRQLGLLAIPLVALLAVVAVATALIAGGGTAKQTLPGNAASATAAKFRGLSLSPVLPAPPLDTLRNYNGASFNLRADRGKAVFVTFLYTHCPDVCPLIASHLHTAYVSMPKSLRSKVAIVAVSVDPHGDTPTTVATFVHDHELTGEASYLIGSASTLVPVWKAWRVGSVRDTSRPDLVNHSALVFGISAKGKLLTLYASNFAPSDIVHDASALLTS
jgi:protein SCO1/2